MRTGPDDRVAGCVFCEIVAGDAPAGLVAEWEVAVAFTPLNPVTPGHTLVVPRRHVPSALANPDVAAYTMQRAASLAQLLPAEHWNIITSAGRWATQTVFHLHIHLVPRRQDDGLLLPWS